MKSLLFARPGVARTFVLVLLAGCFGYFPGVVRSAVAQSGERSVQGRVVTPNDAPIRNAIVYLSDSRTMAVESYITQDDGAYRFEQISPNDDYKLWAQIDGKKSKTKILSSFDDRKEFHVILKIDIGK